MEGSTGVFFFNSFSLFLGCFSTVMHVGFFLGHFCPPFDCFVSYAACTSQGICWFGCYLGAVNGSGVVFEFISAALVMHSYLP